MAPLDGQQVLQRLAEMPIGTWSYASEDPSVRHAGPMAQDFYGAFGLGANDTHIATIDADGVALAAIQGLYKTVQEQNTVMLEQNTRISTLEADNTALKVQNTALEAQNRAFEQRLSALEAGGNGAEPARTAPSVGLVGLMVLGVAGVVLTRRLTIGH